MSENTKIQWATHSWSPWIGCSKVHSGCAHCYAEADFALRRGRVLWGPNGTRVKTSEAYWRRPVKWNREAVAKAYQAAERQLPCKPGQLVVCHPVWDDERCDQALLMQQDWERAFRQFEELMGA